jgi:hypothetical protein
VPPAAPSRSDPCPPAFPVLTGHAAPRTPVLTGRANDQAVRILLAALPTAVADVARALHRSRAGGGGGGGGGTLAEDAAPSPEAGLASPELRSAELRAAGDAGAESVERRIRELFRIARAAGDPAQAGAAAVGNGGARLDVTRRYRRVSHGPASGHGPALGSFLSVAFLSVVWIRGSGFGVRGSGSVCMSSTPTVWAPAMHPPLDRAPAVLSGARPPLAQASVAGATDAERLAHFMSNSLGDRRAPPLPARRPRHPSAAHAALRRRPARCCGAKAWRGAAPARTSGGGAVE